MNFGDSSTTRQIGLGELWPLLADVDLKWFARFLRVLLQLAEPSDEDTGRMPRLEASGSVTGNRSGCRSGRRFTAEDRFRLPLSACALLWEQARASNDAPGRRGPGEVAAGDEPSASERKFDWEDSQACVVFTLAELSSLVPASIREDFDSVLRCLLEDEDEVIILTENTQLELLDAVYVTVTGQPGIPACVLVERSYANVEAHISLLCWGLCEQRLSFPTCTPDSSSENRLCPIAPIEGLHQSTVKLIQEHDAYWRWGVVQILEYLLSFGDTALRPKAQAALEQGIQEAPEVLACALAETPKPTSMGGAALREHALDVLLPSFLMGGTNPNSAAVARRVWQHDRAALIRAAMHCWQKDRAAAARLLDVAQDLKAVPETLAVVRPYEFAIDLALLASRREYINLRKWLRDRLHDHGSEFFGACLNYLSERAAQGDAAALFSLEATATMLKVLTENVGLVDERMREELDQLCRTSAKEGDSQDAFPPEIEERANQFFQRIYAEKTSIAQAITELQELQNSHTESDDMLVRCIIHNLLDEYRFFSRYPDRELRITAELFGALIKNEIVVPHSLMFTLIMRYLLESLRKSPPNKMFQFGLMALGTFQHRLAEWPQYARYIVQMPHLRQTAPEFFQSVLAIVEGAEGHEAFHGEAPDESDAFRSGAKKPVAVELSTGADAKSTSASAERASPRVRGETVAGAGMQDMHKNIMGAAERASTSASPSSAVAAFGLSTPTTLEVLLRASRDEQRPMSVPDTSIQDKVHFIFNNLSPENMDSKVRECFEIVHEEYWDYLAQYIVVKRASIEPNFQATYVMFLEHAPHLIPLVLRKSYDNVRILLNSEKIRYSTAERSVLKNIGMWIGSLTLARNRPILRRDLDLKALILQAYTTGLLIAVIPFVCKILDACRVSRIFRLPNPWIAAIFGLLREIYELSDLKLNLKFEVEVLCKNVEIDLHSVKPTHLLASRSRPVGRENPDFTFKEGSDLLASPSSRREMLTPHSATPSTLPTAATPGLATTGTERPPGAATAAAGAGAGAGAATAALASTPAGALASATRADRSDDRSSFDLGALRSSLHLATTAPPLAAARAAQLAAQTAAIADGVTVIPNLSQYISVNEHPELFQNPSVLKRIVAVAIDRAIREFIQPVTERSALIALVTTRELVAKDFSQADGELALMAGQRMAQALASGLAHITCKDPLRISMIGHLRSVFSNIGGDQTIVEQAVQGIVAENLDTACAIIERAAAERATRELDANMLAAAMSSHRRMPQLPPSLVSVMQQPPIPLLQPPASVYEAFSLRATALWNYGAMENHVVKTTGYPSAFASAPPSVAPLSVAGQSTSAPMGVGGVATAVTSSAIPIAVATTDATGAGPAAAQRFPSGAAAAAAAAPPAAAPPAAVASAVSTPGGLTESPDALMRMVSAEERFMQAYALLMNVANAELQANPEMTLSAAGGTKRVLQQIAALVRRFGDMERLCVSLAMKVFRWLLDARVRLLVETHVVLLKLLSDPAPRIHADVASWCAALSAKGNNTNVDADHPLGVGVELTPDILHALQRGGFDVLHSRLLDAAAPQTPGPAYAGGISNAGGGAGGGGSSAAAAPSLAPMEMAGAGAGAAGMLPPAPPLAGVPVPGTSLQASPLMMQKCDTAGAVSNTSEREQIAHLMDAWQHIRNSGSSLSELLPLLSRFQLDALVPAVVAYALEPGHQVLPSAVDEAALLVVALVREVPGLDLSERMVLLQAALQEAVQQLLRNAGDPRPPAWFLRSLARALHDTDRERYSKDASDDDRPASNEVAGSEGPASSTPDLSMSSPQILSLFGVALHAIRPAVAPVFAFSWLELVSCPLLMPRMLLSRQRAGWPAFQRLLVDALEFLQPFLNAVPKGQPLRSAVRLFYRGVLRLLLVVLHDFPELLVESAPVLCDYIPLHCVQLRNLVLSAFPSKLRLPDPFSPEVTIESATKIHTVPRLSANPASVLGRSELRAVLDEYLQQGAPTGFMLNLSARLRADDPLGRYVVPLVNAAVLYVGQYAVQARAMESFIPVFLHFAEELDDEGRFLLICAMANQIRYPNAHTSFFALSLLHLFRHGHVRIRELIARVLVERLFAARPHPWGLLVVFLELVRNPEYGFWQSDFIQLAPELHRLMDNVARTCLGVADARAAAAAGLSSERKSAPRGMNATSLSPGMGAAAETPGGSTGAGGGAGDKSRQNLPDDTNR
jgi:hypothetical protein